MPENQTAWNSDNQRVKETFIQTGKRGGDRQIGSRAERTWGKAAGHMGEVAAGRFGSPTIA